MQLILYIANWAAHIALGRDMQVNVAGYLLSVVSGWGLGPLWFLSTLMLAELLLAVVMHQSKRKIRGGLIFVLIIVGVVLACYVENMDVDFTSYSLPLYCYLVCIIARTLVAFMFICCGFYAKSFVLFITNYERKMRISFLGVIIFVICAAVNMKFCPDILDLHFAYLRNAYITVRTVDDMLPKLE